MGIDDLFFLLLLFLWDNDFGFDNACRGKTDPSNPVLTSGRISPTHLLCEGFAFSGPGYSDLQRLTCFYLISHQDPFQVFMSDCSQRLH